MSEKLKNLEKKGLKVEQTTVKKKRNLSGVPGSVKASVCERLGIYLKVINFLGDDYMAQRQFVQFCYELGLVEKDERDTKITAIINDLVKADLVKKTRIGVTNAKMLLLTKYAKRWLAGAVTSQEVSATKAYKSDKPYLKSIMRMDYFLKDVWPSFKKNGVKDLDKIKSMLGNNKNSLFLKRKSACDYYHNFHHTEAFQNDLNEPALRELYYWCYYRLAVDKQRLKHALSSLEASALEYHLNQEGAKFPSANWKTLTYNLKEEVGKNVSPVERERSYLRTLYELINRDVVIHIVQKKEGYYFIEFRVFDAYNNADVNKIERSIIATILMFRMMFKPNVVLVFRCKIHAFNDNMKDRIKRAIDQRLEKEHDDPAKAIQYHYGNNIQINYYSMNLHQNYLLSED